MRAISFCSSGSRKLYRFIKSSTVVETLSTNLIEIPGFPKKMTVKCIKQNDYKKMGLEDNGKQPGFAGRNQLSLYFWIIEG